MHKYYVQIIAGNYLKNLAAETIALNVHEKFLYGLTKDEFANGYFALLSLMRQLYSDIANNPTEFGMTLKEIENINAKTPDYTNSNTSFLRMPNLLYILGVSSELAPDGVLTVDCSLLYSNSKPLKITGLPALLTSLRDYGFEISEPLTVSYIDNPFLTTVLKSMANALFELTGGDLRNSKNDYFYMMHPGLLANENVKEPKLYIDSLLSALAPSQRLFASELHDFVESNTKQDVRKSQLMRNEWICTYTNKQTKKVLMGLHTSQDKLAVKLNLQNIGQYISLIMGMPDSIQDVVINGGFECGGCNPRCSGGFAFEINGKQYNKCRCGSFMFGGLTSESVAHFKHLIEKELSL